ncbi:MAG: hypothetical protein FWC72_00510 [Oscillospiraceae bacterium]|nr:hypothetical protein [Oscillospiraceae bacterium]
MSRWRSQIGGKEYRFSYQKVRGSHKLTVNDVPMQVKAGWMSVLFGFDEKIVLDGKEARLVIEKQQPDIVIDNTFLQSGKAYRPRPTWVLGFVILCLALPIITMFGAFTLLLGFGGALACVRMSKSAVLSKGAKVGVCVCITLLAWALWVLIEIGMAAAM